MVFGFFYRVGTKWFNLSSVNDRKATKTNKKKEHRELEMKEGTDATDTKPRHKNI